jgi:O-antigen/teichoic acid export membrane protein
VAISTITIRGQGIIDSPPAPPAGDSRIGIVRDTLWYVAAVYAAQAIGFVGNILSRRYLGPADSGVLALVTIAATYATLTHCGLIDGGNKLIPYWFGKARARHAERLANVMTTGSTTLSFFGSLLAAAVIAGWWRRLGTPLAIGLLVAAVRLPVQQRTTAYAVMLRARKRFKYLSITRFAVAAVNLALIVLLVRWRGLYAMYLVLLLVALVNLVLWRRGRAGAEARGGRRWDSLPAIPKPVVRELFVAGLPILAYGQLFTLIQSLDSVLIARLATMAQVGLYNFGSLICMAVWSAPNGFSAVMFPRSQERFARSGAGELRQYTLLPVTIFSGTVVPALVGAAWILLPAVVAFGLPAFRGAVEPGRILLLGCYFLCLVNMPIQYLVTTNSFRRLIGIELAVIAAMGAGDYYILKSGWGIGGVAAWTAICFAALFVLLVLYGLRDLAAPAMLWSTVGKVFIAFLYFCLLLGLIGRLGGTMMWSRAGDLFGCLLSLLVLGVGLTPMMVITVLRAHVLSASQLRFLREVWRGA